MHDRYVQHGSSWGDGVIYIYTLCSTIICSNDSALFGFVWNLLVSRVVSSDCRTKTHVEATLEHFFLSIWERLATRKGSVLKDPQKVLD